MDIKTPHTFIVAVSGGVDSCVLLHMIKHEYADLPDVLKNNPHIIVAHVDHGIRTHSSRDEAHVAELAKEYGYEYEFIELKLGKDASEEEARSKRYGFLDSLISKYHADAVVTAHHSDDVLETAIINLMRGTGRRGLSSLKTRPGRLRPLLELTKQQLIDYAHENSIVWNEDETNSNKKYLRNKVRGNLENAGEKWKVSFATELQKISVSNDLIDMQIANILQFKLRGKYILSREWFVKLDHLVASECMLAYLRKMQVQNIDRALVERLVVGLKAARPGSKLDVDGTTYALITKRSLRLVDRKTLKTRIV
jgi:tRNA(Ile)-lysidine synthase